MFGLFDFSGGEVALVLKAVVVNKLQESGPDPNPDTEGVFFLIKVDR